MVWIALLLSRLASYGIANFYKKGVNPGLKGLER